MGTWTGWAGVAVIVVYYVAAAMVIVRRRHVADPFQADEQVTPAIRHFAERGIFTGRTLLATIMNLAGKGALALRARPDGSFYLERPLNPAATEALPNDEALVRDALFRSGRASVDLRDAGDPALTEAALQLRDWLHRHFLLVPDMSTWPWRALLGGGILISAIATLAIARIDADQGSDFHRAVLLIALFPFTLATYAGAFHFLRMFRREGAAQKLLIVFALLLALPIMSVIFVIALLHHLDDFGPPGILTFLLAAIGTVLLVRIARPRPSPLLVAISNDSTVSLRARRKPNPAR